VSELDLTLLVISVICTGIFAWASWETFGTFQRLTHSSEPRARHNAEHGLVIACALLLISFSSIVTRAGDVFDVSTLNQVGGLMIRGALIAAAAYLILRHPKVPE
jgi:hypothetical protein